MVPGSDSEPEAVESRSESLGTVSTDSGHEPEDSAWVGPVSENPPKERTAEIYWLLLTVLFIFAIVFRRFPADDNIARHTIWEFISTTLALIVGSLSLVRFYSKKQETFLFIGTGFLGTGLLNGYHAVMTSTLIDTAATGFDTADGAAWTWTASRLFLSMFLFGSVFLGSDNSYSERSHLY